MLSVYLGKMEEAVYYPPVYFDNRYEDEPSLGQTRAPSKGHFTEQAEILHEKRITTSFVSESCMALGNWNHEA